MGEEHVRVLIADNDARVRRALRTLLGQESVQVVIRESSDVAGLVAEAREFQPDLLFLDWELPGRPAAALFYASQERVRWPKIIVLSRRPEEKEMVLAAGADAFVSKDDSPERLLGVYRSLLRELAPETG